LSQSISDSIFGLEQANQDSGNGGSSQATYIVHDDFAHLFYVAASASSSVAGISTAFSAGQVFWQDSLANVTNSSEQNELTSDAQIKSLSGIVVSDSLADFTANLQSTLNTDITNLQALTTASSVTFEVKDSLNDLESGGSLLSSVTSFLTANAAHVRVDIADSLANLSAAYSNGYIAAINTAVDTITNHDVSLTAIDTAANIESFINSAKTSALLQFQNVVIEDTAANIVNMYNYSNYSSQIDPLSVADGVILKDSFANIQNALNNSTNNPNYDPSLLGEVSKVILTSTGSGALNVEPSPNSGSAVAVSPEFDLSKIMSGALNATETEISGNTGVEVKISEASNRSIAVTIDLVGVSDANLNASALTGTYTNGGWYHD
jgi:hypothetical protein